MRNRELEVPAGNPLVSMMATLERRGQAPWQRRLRAYFAPYGRFSSLEVSPAYAWTAEKLAGALARLGSTIESRWPSLVAPGYALALSRENDDICSVPHILAVASDGSVVGAFVGGDVYVSDGHRGCGLGAELMLARAVLHDKGARDGMLYSTAGYAAAAASHRLAIQIALASGKAVPPGVKADHPDLETGPSLSP